MRSCAKRNKRKVWRNTYGKPFIAQRALSMIKAHAASAIWNQTIRSISSATGCNVGKSLALAGAMTQCAQVNAAILENGNRGFANK